MTRIYLRQKMAMNIVLFVGMMVFVFIGFLIAPITVDNFDFDFNYWAIWLMLIFFAAPLTAYLIYADKGYQVSYDDDAVYQRPHGITRKLGYPPEQKLRYADIDTVCGDPGKMINFGIMPFEFIRLYRKHWDGVELFMISPFFLHHEEMKELIAFLYKKRPDAFAQDVIDYLNSEQRL